LLGPRKQAEAVQRGEKTKKIKLVGLFDCRQKTGNQIECAFGAQC
jgi:hypothetical protein